MNTFAKPGPAMPENTRTFIAVHFAQEVISKLDRIIRDLKTCLKSCSKVKWVRPENTHLTLQFLGNVSPEELGTLDHGLSGAFQDMAPFEVALSGVGCFPSPVRPRVLWIGIQSGKGHLSNLQKRVYQITKPLGFVPEDRPFKPHVTLGRVKSLNDTKKLLAFLDRNMHMDAGKCQISALHLMASKLEPNGAVYTILDSFQLGS